MRKKIALHAAALGGAVAMMLTGAALATPPPATQTTIDIAFDLFAGKDRVGCGAAIEALGAGRDTAWLRDARLYVQDIALLDTAGARIPLRLHEDDWQNAQVALLDFEDATQRCAGGTPETRRFIRGTAPPGRYVGLSFTVGVPPALNHTSTELEGAPLDLAAMSWSWQAGRKYLKLELDPVAGVARHDGARAATWFVHLGATGCTGNPVARQVSCLRPNRLPVTLPAFDPQKQQIAIDLLPLLSASQLTRDSGGASGCMGGPDDPECSEVYGQLGLSTRDGEPIGGEHSPVFRAVPRP